MTLNIIHNLRREVRALKSLAQAGVLTPDKFNRLTAALTDGIDAVEAYIDGRAGDDTDTTPLARRAFPRLAYEQPGPGDAA